MGRTTKRLTEAIAACAIGLGLLAAPAAAQDKQLRIFNWSDYVDPEVLDAFKKELEIDVGDTTPDRQFSLDVARCFGACGLAPAITIDDVVYQRVKPTKIREILSKYREPVHAEGKGA